MCSHFNYVHIHIFYCAKNKFQIESSRPMANCVNKRLNTGSDRNKFSRCKDINARYCQSKFSFFFWIFESRAISVYVEGIITIFREIVNILKARGAYKGKFF